MPATVDDKSENVVVDLTRFESETLGLVLIYIVTNHPEVVLALTKEEREAFLSLTAKFADASGEPPIDNNVIPFITKGNDDEILH